MLYMLDTNICSYIIRNKPPHIREKLETIEQHHTVALSSIVVTELTYGATKKGSPKLTRLIDAFIDNFTLYDYDRSAAQPYAELRAHLEQTGKIIGAHDLLIAAHTLSLNAILVTNNLREFERIDGLVLEDWSQPNKGDIESRPE